MSWRKKLLKLVEPELKKLDLAHQIEHSLRVYKNCEKIARDYKKVDLDVLYAASLLHDIGQTVSKYNEHSQNSIKIAKQHLKKVNFPFKKLDIVFETIRKHDDYVWVKNHSNEKPKSIEARIFQDSDRIESIGIMGIIRQFIFAGKHGKQIWDEKKKSRPDLIYGGNLSAIHTIKDHEMQIYRNLNTKSAKKLSRDRYLFMQSFVKQFFKEWKQ